MNEGQQSPAGEQEIADGSSACITHKSGYMTIQFQLGPIQEAGVNGVQIPDVIDVLVDRLQGFQKGDYSCRENALAITKLEEASLWLGKRTSDRVKAGTEGRSLV